MLEYLEIGEIINTHGVRGELKVYPLTDDPKRYDLLKEIYIEYTSGERVKYKVDNVRYFKQFVLLSLEGIDDMNKAQLLKGNKIVVHRKDAVELPEDTYFIADLINCLVYENDNCLGKVIDVISTGSNDVYVVQSDSNDKELLIPAIGHVVLNVDIYNRRIDVKLPEGLREL